jgi:hypothetical protein
MVFFFTIPKHQTHTSYMKITTLLIGASVIGLATAAQAQKVVPPTVVNITGATAFRTAAHTAIVEAFGGNASVAIATTSSNNAANASQVIYKGTFTGVTGNITIRTCWNGSVEGLRALATPTDTKVTENIKYIPTSTVNATGVGNVTFSVNSTTLESATADFAFSDCSPLSTPYAKAKIVGGSVGVIAFAPCVNKQSNNGITNITSRQLHELAKNGTAPLSRFTGNLSDNGTVYNVQRYDGSGTRVIALSEIGYGAANPSKGYVFGGFVLSGTAELCPISTSGNYSTFGSSKVQGSTDYSATEVLGNGGYISGGGIKDLFKTNGTVNCVSVLGTSDAVGVVGSGRVLSYNGEKLDGVAAGALNTADKDKIRSGKYPLWSFENLYYAGKPSASKLTVFNNLSATFGDDTLGTAGVSSASMQVKRTASTAKGSTPDAGLIETK